MNQKSFWNFQIRLADPIQAHKSEVVLKFFFFFSFFFF